MTDSKCFVFRFDDVEVRDREFVLTKAGDVLSVEPKAFRVLQYLLRHPHKLITKGELLDAVWRDVSVSENSVARAVAQLRRLLGDDLREPRYIATVPTVGYRFVCKVEVLEDVSGNGTVTDSANVPGVTEPAESASRSEYAGAEAPASVQSAPAETQQKAGTSKVPRRGRRALRIVFAVCAFCVLLAGVGIDLLKPPPLRTEGFRFGPSGIDVRRPMWSPDGKAIVYVAKPKVDVRDQLFFRYLNSPVGIQLTHLPQDQTGRLAPLGWSTDKNHIIFVKQPNIFEPLYRVYSISIVGGTPEFVMDHRLMDFNFPGVLSPDGKVLVSFGNDDLGTFRLYISDPLGTAPRPYLPDPFATKQFVNRPNFRFSPDGKTLVFIIDGADGRAVWLLPFPQGSKPPRRLPLPLPGFYTTPSFDWMPDSRHVVISLTTAPDLPPHLWMADTETARMTPLTGGPEIQVLPLVAPDGKSVLYAQVVPKDSVVSVSVLDGATKMLIDTGHEESMPAWSVKTGKLVWVSNRNGPYEIWLREPNGSERPVVTASDFPPRTNHLFLAPAISPDGERVIYQRVDASGVSRLWISSLSGAPPLRLTNVEPYGESGG
jgi:DNA-binding winged helix-turn-helix (wHTH) protein/Tol biopolymer transport system component